MQKKVICFFVFILLGSGLHFVCAQFPQFYFETVTTENGLSNNTVTCLYQDKKGFLWIGTTNGLNRYDGNVFQTFFHEEGNNNSLSGNTIVDILEDESGIFWIATRDGGLTRYDPAQNADKQFHQFTYNPEDNSSMPSNRMNAIYNLDENYLLFSTENMSVGFLNKKTFELSFAAYKYEMSGILSTDPEKSVKENLTNNWVHHFASDANYIYLSLLAGGGRIFIFDKKTHQLLTPDFKIFASSINYFLPEDENIWYASWSKGLYVQENYKPGKSIPLQHKQVLQIDDEVTHITSWDENYLLASTKNSGVCIVDKNDFSFRHLLHNRAEKTSIASNRVICMLKDKNNILWLGTNEGLSKYNPVQWQFSAEEFSTDYSKQITHFSLFEDQKFLRICTDNGMYKKDKQQNTFYKNPLSYKNIVIEPTLIYPMQNGNFILNTENGSYWYNPEKETVQVININTFYSFTSNTTYYFDNLSRGSYQVRDMLTDTIEGHEVYIFGTLGWGMGVCDITDKIFYDMFKIDEKSIQSNMTRILFRDSKKNYWVGTSEGLYKWKKSYPFKNEFEQYLHNESDSTSLSGNSVTGMYEDESGTLWITTNNGLNAFNGKTFTRYMPSYASSAFMYEIYPDEKGNLWISVPSGFEVFQLPTKKFQHIEMPEKNWLLKYPSKMNTGDDGKRMYGAGNYLISFYPDSFYFENNFPEIYLTGFDVFDEQLFQTASFSNLHFPHKKNFITISFSSLQLSQPKTVRYKYLLQGLNEEWIEMNNTGKINFTSLPPGKYTLLAKVTNAQGEWSSEKKLVHFSIKPPYWQTWWFYLLCVLAAGGILYTVIRYREKNILQLQTMRNKIANDLHDDVGSALSTINLYSEVAKMKSTAENAELKNILDKISDTSIEMQENMNHIVWSLQPRNDAFEHIILRLKRYAVENLQVKNIRTDFFIDEKLNDVKLSADKRKEFFLIFKEALHNITKYADCSEVKIRFQKIKNTIQLEIQDNGSGFDDSEKFDGNGLHTMRERAATLKGTLQISARQGEGTTVVLQFPVQA